MEDDIRNQQEKTERDARLTPAQQYRRNSIQATAWANSRHGDTQYADEKDADRLLGVTEKMRPGDLTVFRDDGEDKIVGSLPAAMHFAVSKTQSASELGKNLADLAYYGLDPYHDQGIVEPMNTKGMRDKEFNSYDKNFQGGYSGEMSNVKQSDRYLYQKLRNGKTDEEKLQTLTEIMHNKGNGAAVRIGLACLGSAVFAELLAIAAPAVVDSLVPFITANAPELAALIGRNAATAASNVGEVAGAVNSYISPAKPVFKAIGMVNNAHTFGKAAKEIAEGNFKGAGERMLKFGVNTVLGKGIGGINSDLGEIYSAAKGLYKGAGNIVDDASLLANSFKSAQNPGTISDPSAEPGSNKTDYTGTGTFKAASAGQVLPDNAVIPFRRSGGRFDGRTSGRGVQDLVRLKLLFNL